MSRSVMAIDQGTTSTRAMVFDRSGLPMAQHQVEHEQIFPQPGWVEHDAMQIWHNTRDVMGSALAGSDLKVSDIAAVGITQQRETAVVWEAATGQPIYNAIVWQDTRTKPVVDALAADGGDRRFAERTGLPLATYFSAPKIAWILDHVEGARQRAEAGELLAGTIDTWLVWNMTGGPNGGLHITEPTNASRTLLMDLDALDWDEELCRIFRVPVQVLPQIRSSCEVYGTIASPRSMAGVPIAGILGDQQAATFGQACLEPGMAKNTYGTGNFVLLNTGQQKVLSSNGLLTTVAFKDPDNPPIYALEGAIAVTGSLVQWLRDNLGLISSAPEVEQLAAAAQDNGDCYFVPAFSGLFAPYWRSDARGAIVGMSRFTNKHHIARAALEAAAYQSREVIEAMEADSGVEMTTLKVDGGMVANELLMQFQADILGVPVVRPKVIETTALGAAYAAGLAVGFWTSTEEIEQNWAEDKRWLPQMDRAQADRQYRRWQKAVTRTLDWVDGTGQTLDEQ